MLITKNQKKKYFTASIQALQPSIHEEHIEVICNSKQLFVHIDEDMTWKNKIKSVSEKASRAISFLKYAKHFLSTSIVKTLCTSNVEPQFQYCCSVWGCCDCTDILQVQRLENRAARIVTNSHFDAPSKPLIQSLGWKTIRVKELINRQVNPIIFKCLNSIAPQYLCDIFTKNTVNTTLSLRNKNTGLMLP